MDIYPLHISSSSGLTNTIKELKIEGAILTWQEILCEGPTIETVYSDAFLKLRKDFFNTFYDVELNVSEIENELEKLNHPEKYSEIVLWFQYDLFSHINMIAVISLIKQKNINLPIYLVCSGKVEYKKHLRGLTELNSGLLLKHFREKITLKPEDIQIAMKAWSIYCGRDHNLLKPLIIQNSSFKYLSSCLKAHLERFPATKDGLNVMERNILEIVRDKIIKSKHHLLGYALNYQGYYGYRDLQITRILEKLNIFFIEEDNRILLNRHGHEALIKQHNFSLEIDNEMLFGGVNKFEFQFNKKENKLIKTIYNAH